MAKTKSFKELVQRHVKDDKKFAEALLRDGVDALLSGDVETGKIILRDYIKATVGFEKLGAATGAPPKSLIRMFGPRGNPQAKNLFSVIAICRSAPACGCTSRDEESLVSRTRCSARLAVHRRAGTVPGTGVRYDPGSAAHRHNASKTRVNALMALRCVRGTDPYVPGRDTSVSLLVMNSSSTGTPSLVLAMPRLIAGMMSSGLVTRSP
jgi:hypothetical protein